MVAFIGDTNRMHAGQEHDAGGRQVEILRPRVQGAAAHRGASRIPELIRRAFRGRDLGTAGAGGGGGAGGHLPRQLAFDEAEFAVDARYEAAPAHPLPAGRRRLRARGETAGRAKRPLMLCGGGVHISEAADDVSALAQAQSASPSRTP